MDCLFSRITNIHPHPNADKLDLGLVNNWPVIVPKGSFIENEIGLFICPDAKLPNNKVWAEPFLNYTGKENRVRTVKLRGEYSNGIFVKLKDLASEYSIHDEDLMLDIKPEQVAIDLGIGHYSPPLPNDLAVAFPNLPLNLTKTDEENWENIPEHQLLLGQKALVTRKMDGCSATYILTAGGEFYCCGRRFTYKNDCFNRYTKVGHEIVRPALEKWAFGMGGGLLQKINRDTCRFAFKCSAQKYDDKWHNVQKRPLDMSKASKKGRLSLILNEINKYQTIQETSERDILDLVFENGKLIREQTFSEIREIVRENWV